VIPGTMVAVPAVIVYCGQLAFGGKTGGVGRGAGVGRGRGPALAASFALPSAWPNEPAANTCAAQTSAKQLQTRRLRKHDWTGHRLFIDTTKADVSFY